MEKTCLKDENINLFVAGFFKKYLPLLHLLFC